MWLLVLVSAVWAVFWSVFVFVWVVCECFVAVWAFHFCGFSVSLLYSVFAVAWNMGICIVRCSPVTDMNFVGLL